MAQDTALLRYLLKWARRAPWSWSQRDLAFEFDWTNDYISWNTTIGRTGYDMNVSGNVSTGSDGDGSYIQFNGNRVWGVWTNAFVWASTTPVYTQANSFTIKIKAKVVSLPPSGSTWFFGSYQDCAIYTDSAWNDLIFGINGSTSVTNTSSWAFSLWTVFDAYLVYDSSVSKFYCYVWSTLQNAWGTSWPATFSTDSWRIWDWWLIPSSDTSWNKYIYHAAIRNKALTQAEVDADIALWNITKNDPSIVAYYIPDNLQYNTQYLANPKDLDNATRTKWSGTTVTANTTVAPDGTTTADTVVWTGTSTTVSKCEHWFSTISWSTLASKTFIIKAFVKVAAATALFRLKLTHWAVADYFSANQTATTTRQEFTFTQTFTSATNWTGIIWWLVTDTTNTAWSFEVRNVRLYLVNETLRDESPNIWWFIWWKTQKVLSCRYKPNTDFASSPSAWPLIIWPWLYLQDRNTTHDVQIRYDNRVWARTSTISLWSWYRGKSQLIWVFSWTWTTRQTRIYVGGVLMSTTNHSVDAPSSIQNSWNLRLWRFSSSYF